jgi:hypothetical protein
MCELHATTSCAYPVQTLAYLVPFRSIMGRKAVSDAQRAKLLESFRTDAECGSPASYRRAGEAAGVDPRTSRRAWAAGWPGVPAIRDVLATERVLARAHLRREVLDARREAAASLAEEDSIQARADEGKTIRAVTSAAGRALLALHGEAVFDYLRKLAQMMKADDPDDAKAKAARRAFRDITEIVGRLADASATGQRMLALVLGSPTSIVAGELALRPVVAPNADAATLAAEVEAAQRALAELRALEAKEGAGAPRNGVAS